MSENMTASGKQSREARQERWTNPGAFEEVCEALQMARDIISSIRAHPASPWKDQEGTGIPAEFFLDAALAKARGEAS